MANKKRLLTWDEALACVREGAGAEAADVFLGAIQDIEQASATIYEWERRKRKAVADAEAMVTEWIGDVQFISPSGVIMERQTGAAVSYPLKALRAAGVSEEQIQQARSETPWSTVAAARS